MATRRMIRTTDEVFVACLYVFLILGIAGCGTDENRNASADAGADQNVVTGTVVTLDGSGSQSDYLGQLSYHWTFVSLPPGSRATLTDAREVNPTFTCDVDGVYVVNLEVNQDDDDMVTITALAADSAPAAHAGPD